MNDVKQYKIVLRSQMREMRAQLTALEKQSADQAIAVRLLRTYQYRRAKTVLCYVSTPIEVDTHALLLRMLEDGKKVAVPRCNTEDTTMDFYYIQSMDDLEKRTFGVLEPIPGKCAKVTNYKNSICIVPGLAFDRQGYRLGYGKGYYDRFLNGYTHPKIGICYKNGVLRRLHHGRFDIPVNLLLTEQYLHAIHD